MPSINVTLNIEGRTLNGRVEVCNSVITSMLEEVTSALNQHGARVRFSVASPTMQELVYNYVDSGGWERFVNRYSPPWVR